MVYIVAVCCGDGCADVAAATPQLHVVVLVVLVFSCRLVVPLHHSLFYFGDTKFGKLKLGLLKTRWSCLVFQ